MVNYISGMKKNSVSTFSTTQHTLSAKEAKSVFAATFGESIASISIQFGPLFDFWEYKLISQKQSYTVKFI